MQEDFVLQDSKDYSIALEGVTKIYRLYDSAKDRIKETFDPRNKKYHHAFYALRNISLQIPKGQSVGIIGVNGSGKSTLLQLICNVLQPTEGSIEVNGNVSALLELGAGFNPEYTGRENVYLNGAILGYKKHQIEDMFDDIVAFARLGEFIDQPVKTYSSGMYVRLAFAIAVTVDPDIIVIDEALAVGDEAFQRKCFSRIRNFISAGKTLLFVSHGAQQVVDLCHRAILLDRGEIIMDDAPKKVVSNYHKLIYASPKAAGELRDRLKHGLQEEQGAEAAASASGVLSGEEQDKPQHAGHLQEGLSPGLRSQSRLSYDPKGALIRNTRLTTLEGEEVNCLVPGGTYIYAYDVQITEPVYGVRFGSMLKAVSGFELGGQVSHPMGGAIDSLEPGRVVEVRFFYRMSLVPGTYFLNAGVTGVVEGSESFLHRITDSVMFKILPQEEQTMTGIVDFRPQDNPVAECRFIS